jgi:hypothetical protein
MTPRPSGGVEEVGEGLVDDAMEPVGDPETTKRPLVRMAAVDGTDGVLDEMGRVYVSTLPCLNSSLANASSSFSFSFSSRIQPTAASAPRTLPARRRMRFKIAAFRNKLRPRDFCFAHTAILELPRSTILVAGCEYCGERREVMRNNLSRRFFFCMQECSPSMSPVARRRFNGLRVGRGVNCNCILGSTLLGNEKLERLFPDAEML